MKAPSTYALILSSLLCVACEKCAPGRVGQGLSRLTIRNMGAIANAINEDPDCGFDSPSVMENWEASGEPGENGTVTWRTECEVEFTQGEPSEDENCNGVVTLATGRVKITASRTIEGYLTGNTKTPVVPNGPEAVAIHIENAEFDNFKVTSSDSDAHLTMIDGSISGTVRPRVAADADRGVCQVPTGDARLENVKYGPSLVRVVGEGRDFQVEVGDSSLNAINGKFDDGENRLWGSITVWGSAQEIPINDDQHALNPDYDAAKQIESFSCLEDLAQPVRYDCETDVRPLIAQGASQLTIQTIGMLTKLAEADEVCGFSSPDVKYNPTIEGEVGDVGGTAVYTIDTPCEMTFAPSTVIDSDCTGRNTYASGVVRITGTKTVNGYVSGDPEDAIVPTTRDPARIELTADFSDLSVWTDPGENRLTIASGQVTGTIRPRLAIDKANGACSKTTPVTAFENVAWSNAQVTVESEGMTFGVTLEGASLNAQNGSKDGVTNQLYGTLMMDGETFDIPISDNPVLDPDYDQAVFDQRYQCDADMQIPKNDADCNMQKPLAEGAGRLVIQTIGALGTMINEDKSCGFSAIRKLVRPDRVEGAPGEQGLMEWSTSGCTMESNNPEKYDDDCKGREKFFSGRADFEAMRTVRGLREEIDVFGLFGIDSIVPQTFDAVDLGLTSVRVRDFLAYDIDPGKNGPERTMWIEDATLRAQVKPIVAENPEEPGRHDVKTNIAHITSVSMTGTNAQILFEGKRFNVFIDSVNLEAFNGSWDVMGMTNVIRGSVTINGETFEYPGDAGLDPDFELSDFTQRYECRVAGTVPPAN